LQLLGRLRLGRLQFKASLGKKLVRPVVVHVFYSSYTEVIGTRIAVEAGLGQNC
jgi:hypothetical protein